MSLSTNIWSGTLPANKTHWMQIPWGGGEIGLTASSPIEAKLVLQATSGRKPTEGSEWLDFQVRQVRAKAWL